MDSNTILVENNEMTGDDWKPLYLGVTSVLPGFPKEPLEANLGSTDYQWNNLYVKNSRSIDMASETYSNVSDMRLKSI
jgi:hypothetical protein